MEHPKSLLASPFSFLCLIFITLSLGGKALAADVGPVVKREQRRTLTVSEYGKITAINITDGQKSSPYHLQFFTLEPNSLFLPVLLHADMVFYVHTGSGKLTCAEDGDVSRVNLRRGDVASLRAGSVFYLQSNLEPERTKLRVYAIFANTDDNYYDPLIGAYSSISELFQGFDKKILQAAFEVPKDLIEAITNRTEIPAIVHAVSQEESNTWDFEAWFLNRVLGGDGGMASNSKKIKKYNIFDKDPDFQNCNGWSLTVAKKQLKSLKTTHLGFFMVNLTTGSMMGPHWNPWATEIAVVLQGKGMVRVVHGSGNTGKPNRQDMRFMAREEDVFVVSRFHPMVQMSFNNDSFVFMGFSTATKKNHPQFLAGKRSVLQTLDKRVLAASVNVTKITIDRILDSHDDSTILGCVSCAEEEERKMIEEIERKRKEEEARKRQEEEERKREEEEATKREEEEREREEAREREEEEEERKREEEEARKRKEEERAREEAREREEERKREEEEAREREEAKEREEARKREEKEAKRREEQEREREEARKREEEKEEEEEARKREEQEEAEREQRDQEEGRSKQEKAAARREQEEREGKREGEEERERSQEEEQYRIIFEGRRALKMRSI